MSEASDRLEAELSALTPQPVSPELRRRIAELLGEPAPARHRRQGRVLFLASLAASCLLALSVWRRADWGVETGPVEVVSQPAPSAEALHAGPTLLVYQRALARSAEDLDTMLDEDAVVPHGLVPAPTRVSDFTRSVASLDALLGGY
jgi:hypothetical protein